MKSKNVMSDLSVCNVDSRCCIDDFFATKSRGDDTLLTVGFNLRNASNATSLLSPARTTLLISAKYRPCGTWTQSVVFLVRRLKSTVNKVSSLRDLGARVAHFVRRLKPTVNKVSSLQDFSPPTIPLQLDNFSCLSRV